MLTIKTNNTPRNLVYGYELTDKKKAEFDYIEDIDTHGFFIYKESLYDPSEFVRAPEDIPGNWQGIHNETFFSGILIKYTEDYEQIIVASYYS